MWEQEAVKTFACPSAAWGTKAERRVLHRFNQNGRQHPIMTYTEHSLAWFADKWRNPTAREKAVIMG